MTTLPPLMTDEQIRELVGKAPFETMVTSADYKYLIARAIESHVRQQFERAIAAEREACAKAVYDSTDFVHEERDMVLKDIIVDAIRSRGQPPQASNEPELDL